MQSTLRRYTAFKREWEEKSGETLKPDMALILWVEKKRKLDGISDSSALQYTMDVAGALRRISNIRVAESQLLQDYRRSLRRAGALVPSNQARPAQPAEVATALKLEQQPLRRLAVAMCWVTAGRASDVLRLKKCEICIRDDGIVAVHWHETKGDPFKLGRFTGHHLPDELRNILRDRLAKLADPQALLFQPCITSSHIGKAMQRANKALTSHSLRRGAAQHLIRQKVPLDDLKFLTRHESTDTLVRYVAEAGLQRVNVTAGMSLLLKEAM
eukprot:TRINITY_DN57745_c0_g1_i1.p2 TRINITY_DN57745_c0_g1~~TRINITY_DN57745_c0_g1_i1.p2  ORF type:complete len:271 (+),score=46.78 TRINITY_DN57745_c0_g1_i1:439-1251(+)